MELLGFADLGTLSTFMRDKVAINIRERKIKNSNNKRWSAKAGELNVNK